jgi:hypothetical protein
VTKAAPSDPALDASASSKRPAIAESGTERRALNASTSSKRPAIAESGTERPALDASATSKRPAIAIADKSVTGAGFLCKDLDISRYIEYDTRHDETYFSRP